MAGRDQSNHRVNLGTWPTPLDPAPRLSQAIGLNADDLWIKRDDLGGLGGGGNKLRKLEWTLGKAISEGADCIITCGAPQSNHARLTAASGARLGLGTTLVLAGDKDEIALGNVVLDALFGATIIWAGNRELAEVVADVTEKQREIGLHPVVLPLGGSSETGALGYVDCAKELEWQIDDLETVVTAVGSGGTMAGLVFELGVEKVLGVDCGAISEIEKVVSSLVERLSGAPIPSESLNIRHDQVGLGYASLTESTFDAMLLAARCEGLILDPTYTGRSFAGLIAAVREGHISPGQRTVFLHTGGLPGLLGHAEAMKRIAGSRN